MTETELIDDYIEGHIDPESDYLHRLYRQTNLQLLYPRMASGHLQGRLLKMVVKMIRPRLVLEIGTYSGYSALCLAEGLEQGAMLHTFEVNDEQEVFTRPWFENSPYADKITFHIGDALKEVPELGLQFDLAYIDADKRKYTDYYNMVMPFIRPGGFVLADNTLWDGHVVDSHYDHDQQTKGIEDFNDAIASDPRIERVLLPLRDGLTLIRKKQI